MPDITITYDLLFDTLRTEKSHEELQKLADSFYNDVVEYIHNKESILADHNTPVSERELTRIQLGNVKKILQELYERREKKIINLAMYKLKTGSSMINMQALLSSEQSFFDQVYDILYSYRNSILLNVLEGREMIVPEKPAEKTADAAVVQASMPFIDDGIVSVRFIKPVPRFLGPELEQYGPFEENDIASLPSKIVKILVYKQRAELINI
jgi:DNA replication initiation complex subunit (GINS family)